MAPVWPGAGLTVGAPTSPREAYRLTWKVRRHCHI